MTLSFSGIEFRLRPATRRRLSVKTLALAAALAAVWSASACDKTREGEYEVQKPVVGTTTDTIHTPTVETGTVKDTVNVPDVDVKTKKQEVTLPKVRVNPPSN